jgi:hypothetical protein
VRRAVPNGKYSCEVVSIHREVILKNNDVWSIVAFGCLFLAMNIMSTKIIKLCSEIKWNYLQHIEASSLLVYFLHNFRGSGSSTLDTYSVKFYFVKISCVRVGVEHCVHCVVLCYELFQTYRKRMWEIINDSQNTHCAAPINLNILPYLLQMFS